MQEVVGVFDIPCDHTNQYGAIVTEQLWTFAVGDMWWKKGGLFGNDQG